MSNRYDNLEALATACRFAVNGWSTNLPEATIRADLERVAAMTNAELIAVAKMARDEAEHGRLES